MNKVIANVSCGEGKYLSPDLKSIAFNSKRAILLPTSAVQKTEEYSKGEDIDDYFD